MNYQEYNLTPTNTYTTYINNINPALSNYTIQQNNFVNAMVL